MTRDTRRATITAVVWLAAPSAAVSTQGGAEPPAVSTPRSWVAEQQQADGRFPAPQRDDGRSFDLRATSLVLLAQLGGGSSTESGPSRDLVRRGVGWLVAQQTPDGRLGAESSLHDHAIATLALTHAVVLGATERAPAAQRAIDYLEIHGNPGHPEFDLQLAAWRGLVLEATRPAQNGDEPLLEVDRDRIEVLRLWLAKRAADPIDDATVLDLAAELAARVAIDRFDAAEDRRCHELRAAFLRAEQRFEDAATAPDPRATFFASWATYVTGGNAWTQWSKRLTALRDAAREDGELRGTLDPGASQWSREGGRVTSTALALVTLQIYYRYTRLVR